MRDLSRRLFLVGAGSLQAARLSTRAPERQARSSGPAAALVRTHSGLELAFEFLGQCRVHHSGNLAKLQPASMAQVQNGIRIYKDLLRPVIRQPVPFFPLGMPSLADPDPPVALGMRAATAGFIAIRRMNGGDEVAVRVPELRRARWLYPTDPGIRTKSRSPWMTVRFPRKHMAAITALEVVAQ